MQLTQSGILAEETRLARYLTFNIDSADNITSVLKKLKDNTCLENTVIGFGQSLTSSLNAKIPGLRTLPAQTGPGIESPSTPVALWCWLRGSDRGELFHRSRQIEVLLTPAFALVDAVDSFQYDNNRDLSGYEDGTENPQGDEAIAAAIVQNQGDGFDGSSFVAVQQWLHDFDAFDYMSTQQQDNAIGRHIKDNEEFDDAPDSAHVKRTAQESFNPEAFMLRRSMPWSEGMNAGLMFVAFGKSFDAFEMMMSRMLGHEDNIIDGLFQFTQPISGAYFWCPPVKDNNLDLSALGL
jgi:putative iron-dependent peroxidase